MVLPEANSMLRYISAAGLQYSELHNIGLYGSKIAGFTYSTMQYDKMSKSIKVIK